MSIPMLADLTGLKVTTLYDKFNGKSDFTLSEAILIRSKLGLEDMSLDELFQRELEEA